MSQIHLFDTANTNNLEATIIEFEKDTVVLERDTIFKKEIIYTTSSTSLSKIELTALDTTVEVVFEEFEMEINSPKFHIETPGPSKETDLIDMKSITVPDSSSGPEPDVHPIDIKSESEPMPEASHNILFGFDRSTIPTGSTGRLDKLIERMKTNKSLKAEVNGHTDHIGPTAYNNMLSIRRANAVAEYIKSKGIAADRLIIKGYGESKPIAPNTHPDGSDNPSGRSKNRRTEVRLVK